MKLLNAFSINMLPPGGGGIIFEDISEVTARMLAPQVSLESCVGHAETAQLFEHILNVPVAFNRCTVQLMPGELAILGQYSGPRLPEGATTLPEGAELRWVLIGVHGL